MTLSIDLSPDRSSYRISVEGTSYTQVVPVETTDLNVYLHRWLSAQLRGELQKKWVGKTEVHLPSKGQQEDWLRHNAPTKPDDKPKKQAAPKGLTLEMLGLARKENV